LQWEGLALKVAFFLLKTICRELRSFVVARRMEGFWTVCILVCCSPVLLRAETVAFPNSPLVVTVADQTGGVQSISAFNLVLAEAGSEGSTVLLFVGGSSSRFPIMMRPPGEDDLSKSRIIGNNWHRIAQSISDAGDATILRVESREGAWWLAVDYRVPRQTARIERRFSIRYEGTDEVELRSISVTFPNLRAIPSDLVEMPGTPVPPSIPLGEMGKQAMSLGWAGPGLVGVRDTKARTALLCWAYSETEVPRMEVERDENGLKASYRVEIADRMTRGKEVSWGSDYLWFMKEDWSNSLASFQRWWDQIGVRVPRDRPRWTETALIYETQIGPAYFDRGEYTFNPYPTIQSLIDKLDYIHGLGFNTIQLMPKHPSPSYAVDDYFSPSRQYGDGFDRLVESCHDRGMHIIVDWIVHGVIDQKVARKTTDIVTSFPDESYRKEPLPDYVLNFSKAWLDLSPQSSKLRDDHPNWFMKREDGSTASIYTWAFDLENLELQTYIIDAMKFYVGRLKVDGFRVDAPEWNAFPNWDPGLPYRPSYSETGAIRLFDKARIELHKLSPEIMLYTEPSDPVFRRMFDVNYSYGELWLYDDLLFWHHPSKSSTASVFYNSAHALQNVDAEGARAWFEDVRAANPIGAKTIHQVDSHDSFWWPAPGMKFRREQFGADGYKALFFTVAFLDGGLMQYPTAENGSEEFVKKVLKLRSSAPEIVEGQCYYLLPKVSSSAVFAVGWIGPSSWIFPMTNFSKGTVKVRIQLRDPMFAWEPATKYELRDIFSGLALDGKREVVTTGADLNQVEVELQPLESAVIAVRRMLKQ
jgi:hypothetical protein